MLKRFKHSDAALPKSSHAPIDQRRWALLAGATIFLLSLPIFARGNWAPVLFALLTDGILAAIWVTAAYGSGSIVRLPMPETHEEMPGCTALRFTTRAAVGLGIMSLLIMLAGCAGVLNRFTAWSLLVLGVAIVAAKIVRTARGVNAVIANERLNAWLRAPAGAHWLWLLVLPTAGFAFVAANVPPGVLWGNDDPAGYDVVEYHFQAPREWYEAGKIIPLPHNAFSYFPFNVEMHYLLAMSLRGGPWAGMYLAQIMHGCFVTLTVIAVYGLAAYLTRSRTRAVIAALAVASVPWFLLLAPVGYNEGGLLLFGTLAVGWAIISLRDSERSLSAPALGGAFAGFACGSKLTAVPMILLATAAVCTIASLARPPRIVVPRRVWSRAIVGPTIFVVAGLLTFCPWLVRNTIWTGNPLFPEATSVMGRGHFSDVQIERWKRAHRPREDQRALDIRFAEGWREVLFDWRYGYIFFPLAFVGLVIAFAGRHSREVLPAVVPATMLFLLAIFWIGFTHLQSRFFVFGVPLSGLLIAHIRGRAWPVIAAVCFGAVAVMGWIGASRIFSVNPGIVASLGLPDLTILEDSLLPPEAVDRIAGASRITLVGDAKAFWYPIEMSRLRYRTVFDADTDAFGDAISAWRGTSGPTIPGELTIVDPGELRRFHQTYWGVPELPLKLKSRAGPVVFESMKDFSHSSDSK